MYFENIKITSEQYWNPSIQLSNKDLLEWNEQNSITITVSNICLDEIKCLQKHFFNREKVYWTMTWAIKLKNVRFRDTRKI
jgi:hypothetical protein